MDQDDIHFVLCGGKNTNFEEILNFESFAISRENY
jgi:hypothetical protein